MFDKEDKKFRCFIVNEATLNNVEKSARENLQVGDQYCQIETPEGDVVAYSGGAINEKTGRYEERAIFGNNKDIELARKHTLSKLNSLKPRRGLF